MSQAQLFALEAEYKTNKEIYDDRMRHLNHVVTRPKKKEITALAQLNTDLQSTLFQMSGVLPPVESFKLLHASDELEADYAKLLGDAETVTSMSYTNFYAWFAVAVVLLTIYFRNLI